MRVPNTQLFPCKHSASQPVFGKANVLIEDVRPVGNYALRCASSPGNEPTFPSACLHSISFSDHHSTGIYSWQWLYDLHVEKYRMPSALRH